MGAVELFFLAIGLSMDAFAVSMCRGVQIRRINISHALVTGLFFGAFQALMPLFGWFLGLQFERYINTFAPWVAFVLLFFIGAKMIIEELRSKDEGDVCPDGFDIKNLLIMSVATSIDALAVGITFALLEVTFASIWINISVIGAVTFALSFLGVIIGSVFGSRHKRAASFAGGAVLIIIGAKILIESFAGKM